MLRISLKADKKTLTLMLKKMSNSDVFILILVALFRKNQYNISSRVALFLSTSYNVQPAGRCEQFKEFGEHES